MKTLICSSKLLLLTSILVTALQAQIPNSGFEDWTDGEPNGWYTSNFPPLIVNVTQTNISHTGNWAAKGEVIDVMTFPMPPLLGTGSLTSPGFPVESRSIRARMRARSQMSRKPSSHLAKTSVLRTLITRQQQPVGYTLSTTDSLASPGRPTPKVDLVCWKTISLSVELYWIVTGVQEAIGNMGYQRVPETTLPMERTTCQPYKPE